MAALRDPAIVHTQHWVILGSSKAAQGGRRRDERQASMAVTTHTIRENTAFDMIAGHARAVLETLREALARRRLYRRTLSEMTALSDRELAELGMPRSDLNRIASQAAHEAQAMVG